MKYTRPVLLAILNQA